MFRIVSFFFKSSSTRILVASLASAVTASLNIYVIHLVNKLIQVQDESALFFLVQVIFLVISSSLISFNVGKWINRHFEMRVADYRKELTTSLLKTDFARTEGKLNRLVSILLFEINTVGNFGKLIPIALVSVFQLVAVLIYLGTVSWQLTVLMLILLSFTVLFSSITFGSLKEVEDQFSKTRFKLHYSLDRLEKGFKDLMMTKDHGDYYAENSIDVPSRETSHLGFVLQTIKSRIDIILNAILLIGFATILTLNSYFLRIDEEVMIQFFTFFLLIIPAMTGLSNFVKQIKNVENALIQIEEFDIDIKNNQANTQRELTGRSVDVALLSFRNLSYRYLGSTSTFQLGPIDLDILENELLVINGGNGSGKSTFLKLMTGLYTPINGTVSLRGEEITSELMNSYRGNFAAFFTDSPVFDDLGYLDPIEVKTNGERLIKVLELEGKVTISDGCRISETNLSQGQKGRLSLLRLLLENKPIYFFDEWAANQDPHFKKKFYKEIVPSLIKEGKTVVLISHDEQYYHIADRIVTLEDGRVT